MKKYQLIEVTFAYFDCNEEYIIREFCTTNVDNTNELFNNFLEHNQIYDYNGNIEEDETDRRIIFETNNYMDIISFQYKYNDWINNIIDIVEKIKISDKTNKTRLNKYVRKELKRFKKWAPLIDVQYIYDELNKIK